MLLILKTNKKIFSLFNLILFIGSFFFTSLTGFASTLNSQNPNHSQKQIVSKQGTENGGCSQLLFEKNETETENENESGTQVQAFLLPFFVSYSQFEISESPSITTAPLAVKQTNPLYLAVCNFRV